MSWNQASEKRVWVIMGLLVAAACDSGDDLPREQEQPGLSDEDGQTPTEEPDAAVDEPEPTNPAPEMRDAGSPLDAAVVIDSSTQAGRDATVQTDAAVDSGPSPAFLRGKTLADENSCASCHQANYAGLGYFPNITPHPTAGIGAWSDQQIRQAISEGVNEKGETLCSGMTRYEFTEAELADLVAFLRGLAPNAKVISPVCPGHNM